MTILEKIAENGFLYFEFVKNNKEHVSFIRQYVDDIKFNFNSSDYKDFYNQYKDNVTKQMFNYYLFQFKPKDMFFFENTIFINKYNIGTQSKLFSLIDVINYLKYENNEDCVKKCFENEQAHYKLDHMLDAIKSNKNISFETFRDVYLNGLSIMYGDNLKDEEIKRELLFFISNSNNVNAIRIAINYYSNMIIDNVEFQNFIKEIETLSLPTKDYQELSEHISNIFNKRALHIGNIEGEFFFFSLLKYKANNDYDMMSRELTENKNAIKTLDENTKKNLLEYMINNHRSVYDVEEKIMQTLHTSSKLLGEYIIDERLLKINKFFPLHFIYSLNIDENDIDKVRKYLSTILDNEIVEQKFDNNMNSLTYKRIENKVVESKRESFFEELKLKGEFGNYFNSIAFYGENSLIKFIEEFKKDKVDINLFFASGDKEKFRFIVENDFSSKKVLDSFLLFNQEEKKQFIIAIEKELFHPFHLSQWDIKSLLDQKGCEPFLNKIINQEYMDQFSLLLIKYLNDDNKFKKELLRRELEISLPIDFDF